MYMANADVEVNLLLELQRLGFSVECKEEESEVWISQAPPALASCDLLRAIEIVSQLRPDEVDVIDGRLRLWWD